MEGEEQQNRKSYHTLKINKKMSCENPSGWLGFGFGNQQKVINLVSVADPGCLSWISDPHFFPSRIPDPKTATKKRGEKIFFVIPFYVATNFTKLKNILVLKC